MSTLKLGLIAGSWKKLAIPLVLVAALFGALVFVITSRVLLGNLQQLENESARQTSLQIGSAFAFDTEHLQRLATSYAEWEDTFAYVRGGASGYLDANYTPSLLESIDVDHVWILDSQGRLVGSASRQVTPAEEAVPVDAALLRDFSRYAGNQFQLRSATPERRFMNLSGRLYSIAARKITRDDLSGDAGTLVFARLWMQGRIDRIAELTRRKLSISPPLAGEGPDSVVLVEHGGEMHVHTWLLQPDGRPAAVVDIDWQRDLLVAARRATLITIVTLIAGFLLLTALLALRLRRSEDAVLRHQRSLANQAGTDALTGLRNRSALEEVSQAVKEGSAAVLYIDVDRFKALNDSFGHAAGDEILREVAQRLQSTVAPRDQVVRLGGDEFLLVLMDVDSREALARIALRVRDQFVAPIKVAGSLVQVTLSIGAALYATDGNTLNEVIRCADLALYEAKEGGRNGHCVYDSELGRRKADADAMRDALARAIRDRGVTVEYQPQHSTHTGELTGFEALARWQDAALGQVPPSRFIALAEQHGMIDALGQQVIQSVCEQLHGWRSRGIPVRPVSINLSARQFDSGTLLDFIRDTTRSFGVEPQLLTFEITESVFMAQAGPQVDVLHRLRALGFHIAIDDFGTGYSSLSYLRLLPVSTIKIDRSFVHDLDGSEAGSALVRSILDIASHFGLRVVAEGVETHEQLLRLRELRCEAVQGYLLNRPMSASSCEQLLLIPAGRRDSATTQSLRIVK
jgi:diguanylate cyclase (GGDEF)-like protein